MGVARSKTTQVKQETQKTLVFRLSSLGDVVLATSFLEARRKPVDWVVGTSFSALLQGHPRIKKLWEFDRKKKFFEWLSFVRALYLHDYQEVFDLHRNLRTRIARVLFLYWAWKDRKTIRWHTISKMRFRRSGYFLFKALWPKKWRPLLWVSVFGRMGGNAQARPNLSHLIEGSLVEIPKRPFQVVMPSSAWKAKEWGVHHYFDWILNSKEFFPVIIGSSQDRASLSLVELLRTKKIPHLSGVGHWNLREVAFVLSQAEFYLGNDTGVAHLCEAVGKPARAVFGPVTPDLGFGLWRKDSQNLGRDLWCRPCSKNGRTCFRVFHRHACLKKFTENALRAQIKRGNSEMESFRLRVYRHLLQKSLHPIVGVFLRSYSERKSIPKEKEVKTSLPVLWVHAASQGELESLWSVVEKWTQQKVKLVITVFSDSAKNTLKNRVKNLPSEKLLFSGMSPIEGDWGESLDRFQPNVFVTAKYEAWPELWASLSFRKIPLVVVGAQVRSSLRVAALACVAMGIKVPKIEFCTTGKKQSLSLVKYFPEQTLTVSGDPRWDRVWKRFESQGKSNVRIQTFLKNYASQPRPWGVLGSIWEADLKFMLEELKNFRGTLWLVPHYTDQTSVSNLIGVLKKAGLKVTRSSQNDTSKIWDGVVVDEMGFLAELYQVADWAFIGGGFSKGVHSTIEPAIHGIPIASGPKNSTHFPEIEELQESNQLVILRTVQQLQLWMAALESGHYDHWREAWKRQAILRRGATHRVVEVIEKVLF